MAMTRMLRSGSSWASSLMRPQLERSQQEGHMTQQQQRLAWLSHQALAGAASFVATRPSHADTDVAQLAVLCCCLQRLQLLLTAAVCARRKTAACCVQLCFGATVHEDCTILAAAP
jgi:hypothetical protein